MLLFAANGSGNYPPAIATLTFDRLISDAVEDASPVFLSEDSLGLLLRSAKRPETSQICVVRLSGNRIQLAASISKPYEGDKIFSISNSRLLISGTRRKYLFSEDLKQEWSVLMRALCKQFPWTGTIGEAGPKGERALILTLPPTSIGDGLGQLLATSSNLLVYKVKEGIRTVDTHGTPLGLIPVDQATEFDHSVEVAGPQRLYFSTSGDERVVDLTGKIVARVHPPDGWGLRHGWSSDGTRLLFDQYIRLAPIGDKVLGWVADALGVTLPGDANAEEIRVTDVATGAVCFGIGRPEALLGTAGGYHADLSPSGRLLAVVSRIGLSVYELPPVCVK